MLILPIAFCTCAPFAYVSPADQASAVPTNTQIVLQLDGDAAEEPPRLLGPDTSEIPVQVQRESSGGAEWYVLQPDAALEPDTTYTIEYASYEGRQASTFTTGTGPSDATPDAPEPGSLELVHVPFEPGCGNSCYAQRFRDAMTLSFTPGPAAYYEIILREQDAAGTTTVLVPPSFGGTLDNGICTISPPALQPGASWCAEMVAVSVTGARSAPSSPVCAEVPECAVDACSDVPECLPPEPLEPAAASGCAASTPGASLLLAALVLLALGIAGRVSRVREAAPPR